MVGLTVGKILIHVVSTTVFTTNSRQVRSQTVCEAVHRSLIFLIVAGQRKKKIPTVNKRNSYFFK